MMNCKMYYIFSLLVVLIKFSTAADESSYVITNVVSQVSIISHKDVSVNYGRGVVLKRENFFILYNKSQICEVSTVKNDYSEIGTILPSTFPCNFKEGDVSYQHLGSMTRTTDVIKLQVRLETDQKVIIKPFVLRIQVVFKNSLEVVTKIENLRVNEISNFSEAITKDVVRFDFDKETYTCNVRLCHSSKSPPYYGSIVNATNFPLQFSYLNRKYMSCEEFLSGSLYYYYRRETSSTNRDYIPLMVETRNIASYVVKKREFFQLPVRIYEAPENEPPIINYNDAQYSLNVDRLSLTVITSNIIKAEDKQTNFDYILFNVTSKYEPNAGFLVHIEDPERPLSTFYQREIKDFKIAYRPPINISNLQHSQQVWFEARDRFDAASVPFYVIFVLKATNTRAPQVIKNTGLTLTEGKSRLITRDALEIRDIDNEEVVTVSVIGGLLHGKLYKKGVIISTFTLQDIDDQCILYQHDDSETTYDNVILRISDDVNFIDVMFLITVWSVDDQAPVLTVNTGAFLTEGGVKRIDEFELSATDLDSDVEQITFYILKEPDAGYLCLRKSVYNFVPEVLTNVVNNTEKHKHANNKWEIVDNAYEIKISEFTQADLFWGNVYYKHYGNEIFNDIFMFCVSDNAKIPNQSCKNKFDFYITPIDDEPPVPHPNSTFLMNVNIFDNLVLTQNVMRYTDVDSNDNNLVYSITNQVCYQQNKILSEYSVGYFFNEENPNVKVTNFYQSDINFLKVVYKFNISSSKCKSVFIYFNVTDSAGNSISNQKITFNILSGITKAPKLIINTLTVANSASFTISSNNIDVNDIDNSDDHVCFSILELPKYGAILLNKIRLSKGTCVSLKDIHENKIKYVHDGTQSKNDSIQFIFTDGIYKAQIELPIVIKPWDVDVKEKDFYKEYFTTSEGGVVEINKAFIQMFDNNDDEDLLAFNIIVQPKFGVIKKNGFSLVNTFHLNDITDSKIVYQHTSGEIGYEKLYDQFVIGVSNNLTGLIIGFKFFNKVLLNVEISPVDNQPPIMLGNFVIRVAEGGTSLLEETMMKIVDNDTALRHINCSVTHPPEFGFFQIILPEEGSEISRMGIPILHFSALDVFNNDISYVQSIHKGFEPSNDVFQLQCTDGTNISPQSIFHIIISPTNDEVPVIFVQQKIYCVEDDFILLDLTKINPFDLDQPEDFITIFVSRKPLHGELLIQSQFESKVAIEFHKTVLMSDFEEALVYQHKGTETLSDSFEIIVCDGLHNTTKEIEVTIVSVDDEAPRLTSNNGLCLEKGETKVITKESLNAVDTDSDDASLVYIIRTEPKFGKLQMAISSVITLDLREGDNFTQKHINERRIRYTHDAHKFGEHDAIVFDVTDGLNKLINQKFNILLTPEDLIHPSVVFKDLILIENNQAILTTDLLSASDSNSPDENLLFTVTKIPLRGHLANIKYPFIPITRFTQLQLAENKIIYKHTSADEVKIDSFEFEVTDGRNKLFRTFRIKLLEVNNKIPVLKIKTIQATQNRKSVITPFELYAIDNDTSSTKILYKVVEAPKYGRLLLDGINIISNFTQNQIDNNRILYHQDGSEITSDSFTIKLMNEHNSEYYLHPDTSLILNRPIRISISTKPLDIQPPTLKINNGATSLILNDNRAIYIFLPEALEAIDNVFDPSKLQFIIKRHPKNGIIASVYDKSSKLLKFTQQDINERRVIYVLKQESEAISDFFIFDVADTIGNRLKEQKFTLNWSWVKFIKNKYTVKETDEYIKLHLQRNGYLEDVSFVSVHAIDGTAKYKENFDVIENQVHFNKGQTISEIKIKIIDNNEFERFKSFTIMLNTNAVQTLINHGHINTSVEIFDPEDEPRVEVAENFISVEESIGVLHIPLKRFGDLNDLTRIICETVSVSALGTNGVSVLSGQDFISRMTSDPRNIIDFKKSEYQQDCLVKIIDDSLYEDEETFIVKLNAYYGGKIGFASETKVLILKDPMDEPYFFMSSQFYVVSEEENNITFSILRSGTDLSMKSYISIVTVEDTPLSAKSNVDYLPIATTYLFEPYQNQVFVTVQIYDDADYPLLEGKETFLVILKEAKGGRIAHPSNATITIDDSESDKPIIYFENSQHNVDENCRNVSLSILKSGDLQHESLVRCYTREGTAKAGKDFKERRNADSSLILFKKGDFIKICLVEIFDDTVYESNKNFEVFLSTHGENVDGNKSARFLIGRNHRSIVEIKDNDKSIIEFKQNRYHVKEPFSNDDKTSVTISIHRTGDVSLPELVTVFTKDGSAKSGQNYEPFTKLLEFSPNVTKMEVSVLILYDDQFTLRTAFSLHLYIESQKLSSLGNARTVIYIEKPRDQVVLFPSNPVVVSLNDYDNVANAKIQPINGYPLICITACNPKFPIYKATKNLCAAINNSLTKYKWQISSSNNLLFKDITMSLFFTNPYKITLDSIYFSGGSQVRCIAQAFTNQNLPGATSASMPVTIDAKNGLCMSTKESQIDSKSFSAQVSYISLPNTTHSNLIKLSVLIPHIDGLLPLISTKELSNPKLSLSPDRIRTALYKCSNLLNADEIQTLFGFNKRDSDSFTQIYPYEFDSDVRGRDTVRFYQNLDLDLCLWKFESHYDMSELINECEGSISTNDQIKSQAVLYIILPFYVSYLHHSGEDGWIEFQHQTFFHIKAQYETAIMSENGVKNFKNFKGNLYLKKVSIRESDKRLQVTFKTKALFNGLFILQTKGLLKSNVRLLHHPKMIFSLLLINTEATYMQPEQLWQFTSNYAIHDYSGTYLFNLIPCIATVGVKYTSPPDCTPHKPISFQLNLTIQQTKLPAEAAFRVKTRFSLFHSEELRQPRVVLNDSYVMFKKGERIHGRVMIDPIQIFGNGYEIIIEKVFLCNSLDGYAPTFDPKQGKYGCISESPNLSFRLKILDRLNPEYIQPRLNGVNFNAEFVATKSEDNFAKHDSFSFESSPLFTVSNGGNWYLHVIYSIQAAKVNAKTRSKRNTYDDYSNIYPRSALNKTRKKSYKSQFEAINFKKEVKAIGLNSGTDMQMILLVQSNRIVEENKFYSSSAVYIKGNGCFVWFGILLLELMKNILRMVVMS
ncbi:FRAS1-related extracellular matrix protein 2 isoform X3 [Hydra vulgaris]|uniref:FRAS1-related extracellular matrix protein 2 isoform X3 n=1 Tax=Hydra vulgaris TaxID=6087 RepID=A0ABM4D2R3_HYDVU